MANNTDSQNSTAQGKPAGTQGSVQVGGNVDNVIIGNNNVIHYYVADGEKREMRTGWFYGHRYGDLENFTGRAAEMTMLDEWLANDHDNLLVLTAFGGFGKSALTWQWFNNRVDKAKWRTAVWWSFYEKESGFESFLAETLNHLGVEAKASARQQLNDLLEALRATNILIVLDGFERLLRQYGRMDAALQSDDEDADIDPSQRDCSSPLTETFLRGLSGAGMKSKILMTTRLCPRVLESADGVLLKGCREEPLAAFSPEDAVTYFHNEGIKATRAEVIEACAAYGYHPLSLSLLVGLINADHEQRGDIAAVKNLQIFEDVKARRHHVLERAYGSLAPERRDLLSKMSCFRGSMEYAVLKKVFPSPDLDKALLDLRQRGLLQYTGETGRYDMHPIVRHYAYDHFHNKNRIHQNLAKYFRKELEKDNPTWYRFLPVWWRNILMSLKPNKAQTLDDLVPVIELYHHTVRAGKLDEACDLYYGRFTKTIYFQFGAYQLCVELLRALFPDGEDKPPRLKKESDQAWALNALANSYSLSGQPRRAVSLYEMQNALREKAVNKKNLAIRLGAEASGALLPIGALSEAERNLRRQIDLDREIANEFDEAMGHQTLGHVLSYRGAWQEAEQELDSAISIKVWKENPQGSGVNFAFRALRYLLTAREPIGSDQLSVDNVRSATECAIRALELADETARTDSPVPRDYIRAHWLLGAAYRANNELTLAEENLSKALNLCRQINMVDHEADILLEVARLSFAYALREAPGPAQDKLFEEAKSRAEEALVITERCGYVLQGADMNNFLAELALAWEEKEIGSRESGEWGGKDMARKYAEEAKRLATCDGPPYYYKVAYEEAERLLEKLK